MKKYTKDQMREFIKEKTIVDHSCVDLSDKGMSHEVFNPKSNRFLDFDYFMEDSDAPKGLTTLSRITHGFRLTRWGKIYSPYALKDSVSTLLEPYPVPVKPSHKDPSGRNSDIEGIGRVSRGRYVDDIKINNPGFAVYDAINESFSSSKFNKAVVDALKSRVLTNKKFPGLGYMLVESVISDAAAIEKILDKRYLTVSVEMQTDQYINPITGNDWEYDIEHCGYEPGEIVDGIPAIMVAGNLTQKGYAYTTTPADEYAQTFQTGYSNILDSIVENAKTPMVFIDREVGSKLQTIFDHFSFEPTDGIVKDSNTNFSTQENTMQYDELVKELIDALNQEKDFEHKDLLLKAVDDEYKPELTSDLPKSMYIGNMPVYNEKVYTMLTEVLDSKEVLDSVKNKNIALLSIIKENLSTVEEKHDNNDIEDNSNQNHGDQMTVEEIVKHLQASKEDLAKVLDSFKESEFISSLIEKAENDTKAKILEDNKSVVEFLTNQLKDSMAESLELKSTLKAAIQDSRQALERQLSLVSALASKEVEEVDTKELTFEGLSKKVEDSFSSLDIEAIRSKVFELGSEPNTDEPVIEPGTVVDNDPANSLSSFSKDEILVARQFKEKLGSYGKVKARAYLSAMKKSGVISDSYNVETVLAVLGNNQ